MKTIIIVNIIGILILFAICIIFAFMLKNAYNHIDKLESDSQKDKKEIKKYIQKIKSLIGDEEEKGFDLGERK